MPSRQTPFRFKKEVLPEVGLHLENPTHNKSERCPPLQMNGWNLEIPQLQSGKLSEPNLHFWSSTVQFQGVAKLTQETSPITP